MIIKTRVFELSTGSYKSLSELARAMGISVSQVYRVCNGKRSINRKFIVRAMRAFPGYNLDDLFYLAPDGQQTTRGIQEPSENSNVKIAVL